MGVRWGCRRGAVGGPLDQDGVLTRWDMITGEELMTKAITQTTKDIPSQARAIDSLVCSQQIPCRL